MKNRKVHKPLLYAVVGVLKTVFKDGKKADKAIQYALKSGPRWGSRDRAFIASYSYTIVRWWRLFHFINETDINGNNDSTLWRLLGIVLRLDDVELPEMKQFAGLDRAKVLERYDLAQTDRKVRESIPDWLDRVGEQELGQLWDEEIHALNHEARVGIRVNTLKTNIEEVQLVLKKEGIYTEEIPGVPNALYLKERKNVFGTLAFRQGYFEVQDPGSQLIAHYLGVRPNMRVIDACAGAGGKTLSLAAQMENKGTIIALDTEEWKLKELKRRARRAGVHNIDARTITTNKVIKRLKESADRLLLDVPCSGTGVLRRNPDAKWKLDQEFLDRVRGIQSDILSRYAPMVKPGGLMVYATCSIFPSENNRQVSHFLENHSNYSLVKERSILCSETGYDGFYMALIEKT